MSIGNMKILHFFSRDDLSNFSQLRQDHLSFIHFLMSLMFK